MRFGRSIAVTVLATGLMWVGLARAGDPEPAKPAAQKEQAKPAPPPPPANNDEPHYPPSYASKVGTVEWKPTELKPEHGMIQSLAGSYTTKVHLYSGPFARMRDTEGVAEGKILVGGPFVQITHSEKRMKEPYDAQLILGFDIATGKFVASAISTTSTAIIDYFGTYDAAKKQLTLNARYSDQKSHQLRLSKIVLTLVDATTWTYDESISYKVGDPDIQVVTITFKR